VSRLLRIALVMIIPALVGFTWPGTVEWLCTRGIRQYEAGEFTEAGESFERALEHRSVSDTLQFNRGDALYRQQRFEEAAEAFSVAGNAGERDLARDAAYNLGNTHFSAGDHEAAIEAYRKALRLDPSDMDARHNLELAMQRQQEQQQEQQDEQQPEEQEDEQESEPEPDQQDQEQDSEDQPQEPQEEQQPQEQEPEEQEGQSADEQGQEQPSQPQPADEGELSAEQARRLLHALASQDAEMQKLIRRAPARRQPAEGEKDW
jgi:Ca-activated chloride channel homolog